MVDLLVRTCYNECNLEVAAYIKELKIATEECTDPQKLDQKI